MHRADSNSPHVNFQSSEELADFDAPPSIDEGIRDISLIPDLDVFFRNLQE